MVFLKRKKEKKVSIAKAKKETKAKVVKKPIKKKLLTATGWKRLATHS